MEYLSSIGRLKIAEILITILFCGATLATRYLRLPFRYMLSIPLSLLLIYSLFLSIVPPYLSVPDKQAFFQTQQNKIITMSSLHTSQEFIQIKTNDTEKKISISTGQQERELTKEKTSIQYISPKTGTQTQVFFISKDGGIVQIFPQSSIEIQGLYPNHMQITLQKGTIATAIPEDENPFFTLSTTGQTTNQNIVGLQKNFENNKQQYIKKQRGSPFFYNPISIQFQQKILDLAYKLFPQIYTEKRQNFLAFRQAIDLPVQETRNIQTDTSTNTQEILQQGNRGREETNIYQWFHKFF